MRRHMMKSRVHRATVTDNTYADYDNAELEDFYPAVVHVDGRNRALDNR